METKVVYTPVPAGMNARAFIQCPSGGQNRRRNQPAFAGFVSQRCPSGQRVKVGAQIASCDNHLRRGHIMQNESVIGIGNIRAWNGIQLMN
jgi:hypothetical protein